MEDDMLLWRSSIDTVIYPVLSWSYRHECSVTSFTKTCLYSKQPRKGFTVDDFHITVHHWPLNAFHFDAVSKHISCTQETVRFPARRANNADSLFMSCLNTLRPRQNGRHFPDDIFKWIFLNENVWISINISLKFVARGAINNSPTLVQVMAWRRPGDKPLSELMMVYLLTHICVIRPQWVKTHDTVQRGHATGWGFFAHEN